MYVKLFKTSKGGGTASIKYLLNEREQQGTAKILKGDRKLTEDIIKSISNKHKTTVGVLSFEEQSLTAAQKEELMAEFEKTIFAGMSPDEYNILWVEHTDKDRLEINFVIPKIHLPTQKAFNPYFHEVDFPRVEMFEDIYNIKFNLSSKKDPSKAQTLLGAKKEFNLYKDFAQLDEELHELVDQKHIQSREQLIELLINNSYEITRQGKDYLSIKTPEAKKAKKFKGSIYDEQFTSLEKLEALSEATDRRIKEFHSRDTSRELEQTIRKLDSYNEQKARHHREKFQQKNERNTRTEQTEIQPQTPLDSNRNNSYDISISGNSYSGLHPEKLREIKVGSTKRDEIHGKGNKVHKNENTNIEPRQDSNIHQDRERTVDDFRRRAIERNRAREEALQRIREQNIAQSIELRKELELNQERIREQLSINQTRVHQHIEQDSKPIYEQAQRVVSEQREQRSIRERFREAINSVREGFEQFEAYIVTKLLGVRGELESNAEQSESLTRTAESYKLKIEREQEPEPSYSYGMRMR